MTCHDPTQRITQKEYSRCIRRCSMYWTRTGTGTGTQTTRLVSLLDLSGKPRDPFFYTERERRKRKREGEGEGEVEVAVGCHITCGIRTLKELQSPPPKAARYGFKLCRFDIAPWQQGCQGGHWSRIQRISVHPGQCDGPIVPNPKTPRGNGFLKVCAEFQT
jgi:hypothetical protein